MGDVWEREGGCLKNKTDCSSTKADEKKSFNNVIHFDHFRGSDWLRGLKCNNVFHDSEAIFL